MGSDLPLLPHDDQERMQLHNEVHARPTARMPGLVVYVTVLNEGISREQ